MFKRVQPPEQPNRDKGWIGTLIFGIFWTAFSSIFLVVGLLLTLKTAKQSSWQKVPCVIERFEIRDDPKKDLKFQADLQYRYEWQGKSYVGTQFKPDQEGSNELEDLAKIREPLALSQASGKPDGASSFCHVNSSNPETSALTPPSVSGIFGGLFFAAFGGGFVMIGLFMILGAIKRKRNPAVSDKRSDTKQATPILYVFFTIFAIAGLGITLGLVVPTVSKYLSAKNWQATPARVIWSRVESHSGSKGGTTYSVDVLYGYEFQGRRYRSNTYEIQGGSSSGRDAKAEKVATLKPNTQVTCYVNPEKPWQAVIKRDLGWGALLLLFPLPFMAIGFGGLYFTLKKRRQEKKSLIVARSNGGLAIKPEAEIPDLPEQIMQTGRSRWLALLVSLFIAAFWNGIVSVFVGIAWNGWRKGHPEWFLMIFLIPFVLIGTFLLLNLLYRIVAVFLARYELRLTPGTLRPGGNATLVWQRSGGFGHPRTIRIRLIGEEVAFVQNGKNRNQQTLRFHDPILAEFSRNSIQQNRPVAIAIPTELPPSFVSGHHKIVWKIQVESDFKGLPNLKDDLVIQVRPLRREELPS